MSGGAATTALYVSSAGVDTFVRRRGDGPPLLLLHGNPDTGALWDGVVRRLRAEFTCWVPDLPGFGFSRAPGDWGYRLEDMARWVTELIEGLDVAGPLLVAGHDFGGVFALAFACRHRERLGALALADTVFHRDYRWHFWARVWRTPVLGELVVRLMRWPIARRELARGGPGLDLVTRRAMYNAVTPHTRRAILRLYRATDPANFAGWDDQLPALTAAVPTVVLWGERDPYLPPSLADRFGAREVHRFDCGHWVPSERPEETAAVLGRFFARAAP